MTVDAQIKASTSSGERLLSAFRQDRTGSITIVFAIVSLVMILVACVSVDYVRAYQARLKVQELADAALATIVKEQRDLGKEELAAHIRSYFGQNENGMPQNANLVFKIEQADSTVFLTVSGRSPNTLLTLARFNHFDFSVLSQARTTKSAVPNRDSIQ